jgi:hypothetical protein
MKRFLFVALVAGLLVWQAVPGAGNVDAQQPDLSRAIAAQERHTPGLLNQAGIVGTGVGVNSQGNAVIRVYVQTPTVPAPAALDNIPVERVVTGQIVAQCLQAECARPVPLGVSTGHPSITAGTIGARVKDGAGNVYALSNNHVYANSNNANIGDSILQPGPYDGGTNPEDKIGTLAKFEPIKFDGSNNEMDAAIASTTKAMLGNVTYNDGYKPTSSTAEGAIDQLVKKTGRTTGLTSGKVTETNVTVTVCYQPRGMFSCAKSARFVNQISISGSSGSFSAGGDSGSLIVTQSGNNPVGLLFAGSSSRTFANRIQPVLTKLGVSIDDSNETSQSQDNEKPSAPILTSATAVSSSRIDLAWTASNDNVGVTGYKVYRGGSLVATLGAAQTAYSDTGLSPATTYAYHVTALDAATNESLASNTRSATTLASSPSSITLSASGSKVKGVQHADLTWSGATSTNVDIFRNGGKVVTTPNDGAHTDNIGAKGGGSYTYRVCEAGTNTCSGDVTITF